MELRVNGVLETCLDVADLAAAERFYAGVLGLEVYSREAGRHTFFRCGNAMFLLFDPARTIEPPAAGRQLVVPPHGALGPGHVALQVPEGSLQAWTTRLAEAGIPIEADVVWPGGGRSLDVRDPGGNSVELASSAIWGIEE